MTLYPQSIPPVPDATAAAVHAAFPKGNVYVDLRAEFGTLYNDQLFVDLYPVGGRPVEIAPWRLALVLIMQFMEGLTDRQAADAVRRCMDWKYALSLELSDPGFDFTLLHDFRERLLDHAAGQRLLDEVLTACKARGLLKARGTQRTDSTHVLAAMRTLHHLECLVETLHATLNQVTATDPAWVQARVPVTWFQRYGLRAEQTRLPKETTKREALALQIGADGYDLLAWLSAPDVPTALTEQPMRETLRQIWVQQFYRCTIPGYETLRLRSREEKPPSAQLIASPYECEARYSSKRDTHWVGYKIHLTETCDPGYPDLITQVVTTPATQQDSDMGLPLHQDLAARNLLPGRHLLDSGYIDAQFLVAAQERRVAVVGPPFGSYSRQHRERTGYDLQAFAIDWAGKTATCPQGKQSAAWNPGRDHRGGPTIRVVFRSADCRICPARPQCTSAVTGPRLLNVRPQAQHEALQYARSQQETSEFKTAYALRAGVESTIFQHTHRFAGRRSRYRGLVRTQLQEVVLAVAMNLARVVAWLWDQPLDEQRRDAGPFARLSPYLLSRQATIC